LLDVNRVIEEFLNLAYLGVRSGDAAFVCSIEKKLDPSLPEILAFPQELSRVLLNLFNNSFYATNERSLQAKASGTTYSPKLVVSTFRSENNIIISVYDNGVGIPSVIKEKIFNPFFTTKPTGKGTGLGLSMSYDIIVKGHNGHLRVESAPGEFTEFIIELPI
jgi:two-component system, NtrC family, sensor kinase